MSLASVFQSVETFVLNEIQHEEVKLAAWWKGFEPTVEADWEAFYAAMKPIAFGVVVGLAEASLGGPAKLAVAAAQILNIAKAQGVKASQTMADTLVQQFVASLGNNKPQ